MEDQIIFPHLGITLEHVGKSISVFGIEIAYYGIIIALGILTGFLLAQWIARRTGQDPEVYLDLILYAVFFAIVGARLYYVIFSWDMFRDDLLSIFNLRNGGLAIYGGVIGAVLTVYVFSKKRKLSFPLMLDTGGPGLIAGQIIGRWGNFFNREAFGDYTDGLFAMQLPVSQVRSWDITENLRQHIQVIGGTEFIQVHPTFLYEGMWNLCILIFMLWYWKRKKFNGEIFCIYLAGYGLGRFWIEGLRTDPLLLPGIGIPVSQVLALALFLIMGGYILYRHMKLRRGGNREVVMTEEKQEASGKSQE
ncbi:MAG: prolipoprotein diacylglyceryl transferase [Lachnospiraceae bacterium]|nr:prolipoprotein diacylglyceryl transferase [Lachnospiraceae bacterium]MCI9132740.1 prolipoprotein diacylglyceryl transferase [Lachnospiraceae bacterium]